VLRGVWRGGAIASLNPDWLCPVSGEACLLVRRGLRGFCWLSGAWGMRGVLRPCEGGCVSLGDSVWECGAIGGLSGV